MVFSMWLTTLVIHLLATAFMTGLIWFVQIVHYPLLANVGAEAFPDYVARHMRGTTCVVGPAMLIELVTGAVVLLEVVRSPALANGLLPILAWTGMALLGVIWLSTAALQVPAWRKLQNRLDPATHRYLVRTNWIRTVAWSLRSVIVAAMLVIVAR
ncbi:MAG: hypothetical protein WD294_00790 [Phycisphaeraceae bacterium]